MTAVAAKAAMARMRALSVKRMLNFGGSLGVDSYFCCMEIRLRLVE
jgi:hypothetical protein